MSDADGTARHAPDAPAISLADLVPPVTAQLIAQEHARRCDTFWVQRRLGDLYMAGTLARDRALRRQIQLASHLQNAATPRAGAVAEPAMRVGVTVALPAYAEFLEMMDQGRDAVIDGELRATAASVAKDVSAHVNDSSGAQHLADRMYDVYWRVCQTSRTHTNGGPPRETAPADHAL